MTEREELEALSVELGTAIRAGEEWQAQYKEDPETFGKLVRNEQAFEMAVAQFLKGMRSRLQSAVNWEFYRRQAIKAYDVVVDVQDDGFEEEENLMLKVVMRYVETATELGVAAAAAKTRIPLETADLQASILNQAGKQAADLVKGVSSSTKKLMQASIQRSIDLGETDAQAAARLTAYIGDPRRALTIARTENVRAYGNGYALFAKSTGAVKKVWHCVIDPCVICQQNEEQVVGIDELFNSGDDVQPAHPNCRCSVGYIYAGGEESE